MKVKFMHLNSSAEEQNNILMSGQPLCQEDILKKSQDVRTERIWGMVLRTKSGTSIFSVRNILQSNLQWKY